MEFNILLVEDTASDAELVKEALQDSEICYQVNLVTDGEQALDFLKKSGDKPHLMLLDLNLPKKSGLEVLREVRSNPDPFLSVLPIIVLTNSRSRSDVLRAYTNGCNAYVRKPIGFENLVIALKQLSHFWFNRAILPESVRSFVLPVRHSDYPLPPKSKPKK